MRSRLRRLGLLGTLALGALLVFGLAQAVPYGRDHASPAPTAELRFASARTAQLFKEGCADCHSGGTEWPWYSNVAPMSWLVQHDVDDGRRAFDISHWDRSQPGAGRISEAVVGGEMPPLQYRLIHSAARLSTAERRELAAGLTRSLQADPPGAGARP